MRSNIPPILRTLIFLGLALLATTTHARLLEVKKNGTKEFSVLQDALSAAATGDTVLVHAGAYAQWTKRWHGGTYRRAVGFVESGVTILGTSYAAVIRAPTIVNSVGLYSVTSDSFSVQTLRFQGRLSTGVVAAGSGNAAAVDSCLFEDTSIGIAVAAAGSSCWVRKCEFRDSTGVLVNAYGWAQVRDCELRNAPESFDYALLVGNGATAEMFDCTVENGGVVQVNTGASAVVRDITSTGIRTGALVRDPGSVLTLERISFDGLVSELWVPFGIIVQNDGTLIGSELSITNMWRAIQFESAGSVTLHNSHILGWDEWAVISLVANDPPFRSWDLTGNWWGTTDSTAIADAIWDGVDDQALNEYGIVDFWPIAPGPVPTRAERVGSLKAMYKPRRQ